MAGTYYSKLLAIQAFVERVRDAAAAADAQDLLDRLEGLLPFHAQGLIVDLEAGDVRAVLTEHLPDPAEDDSFHDLLGRLEELISQTEEVL